MSKTYQLKPVDTLPSQATSADVKELVMRILDETTHLDERVRLQVGNDCHLVPTDEREKELHPHTVTVKVALEILVESLE